MCAIVTATSELFLEKLNLPFDLGNPERSFEKIPRLAELLRPEFEVNKYLLTEIFDSVSVEENAQLLAALHECGESSSIDGASSTKSPDSLSKAEFLHFLFSDQNSLLDPLFTNQAPTEIGVRNRRLPKIILILVRFFL